MIGGEEGRGPIRLDENARSEQEMGTRGIIMLAAEEAYGRHDVEELRLTLNLHQLGRDC